MIDANNFQTIQVTIQRNVCYLRLNRPAANNSINNQLIQEIKGIFRQMSLNKTIKVLVFEGNEQAFCTGMDFNAVAKSDDSPQMDTNDYYNVLKMMATCGKVIISKVDGKVNAGGIGIVAASDIVIASPRATFGLSEALFGLLPACVMPFLIRRVGVQKAQWMTLMTQGITTQRAYEIGLVDELSDNTADTLRRNLLRLTRLETETILDLKDYVSKLWIINETTQQLAVDKITTLMASEKVQNNINNFVKYGKFPWSK